MKKSICILLFFALILTLSVAASAHSGRTDAYGGHNDNINGGYHYHHGYPAHDHPGGICPYITDTTPSIYVDEETSSETIEISEDEETSSGLLAIYEDVNKKEKPSIIGIILLFPICVFIGFCSAFVPFAAFHMIMDSLSKQFPRLEKHAGKYNIAVLIILTCVFTAILFCEVLKAQNIL